LSESDKIRNDLIAQLKTAGIHTVQRDGDVIEFQYFLNVLEFIGERSKKAMIEVKSMLRDERRKVRDNERAYCEIVTQVLDVES
jgi:hypothetical protein